MNKLSHLKKSSGASDDVETLRSLIKRNETLFFFFNYDVIIFPNLWDLVAIDENEINDFS